MRSKDKYLPLRDNDWVSYCQLCGVKALFTCLVPDQYGRYVHPRHIRELNPFNEFTDFDGEESMIDPSEFQPRRPISDRDEE